MAGLLENMRKRRKRVEQAKKLTAEPVQEASTARKTDKSGDMVRDITRRARAANPPISLPRRTMSGRAASANPARGLRAAPNTGGIDDRIKQLESEMAAKRKNKLKSSRMAMEARRRRAATVLGD